MIDQQWTGGPELGDRIHRAKGGGSGLSSAVRGELEPLFGGSLETVRIHDDREADRLSRAVDARAFTTGRDIFFRSGLYDPTSTDGLHLLAHEVAHTVQQAAGPVSGERTDGGVSISHPADAFETEAHAVADAVVSGADRKDVGVGDHTPTGEPAAVQREPAAEEESLLEQAAWFLGGELPGVGPAISATHDVKEGNPIGAVLSTLELAAELGGYNNILSLETLVTGTLPEAASMDAAAALGLGGEAAGAEAALGTMGALGPALEVIAAFGAGWGTGRALDSGVDMIGDAVSGNEQADHSISGGIADVMTGADTAVTGLLRDTGVLDESQPEYTQTLGWQLAQASDDLGVTQVLNWLTN